MIRGQRDTVNPKLSSVYSKLFIPYIGGRRMNGESEHCEFATFSHASVDLSYVREDLTFSNTTVNVFLVRSENY